MCPFLLIYCVRRYKIPPGWRASLTIQRSNNIVHTETTKTVVLWLEMIAPIELVSGLEIMATYWLGGGTSQSELFSGLARVSRRKINAEYGADRCETYCINRVAFMKTVFSSDIEER